MIRRVAAIAALFALPLMLAACNGGENPVPLPTATATVGLTATVPVATSTPTVADTPTAVDTPTATATATSTATIPAPYAAQVCVGAKQSAAGVYCQSVLQAWASAETSGDTSARDAAIESARSVLESAWADAEQVSLAQGADCSDLALTAVEAADIIDPAVQDIAGEINGGLDLNNGSQAQCGADLLSATASRCDAVLAAEGHHLGNLAADSDGSMLADDKTAAEESFSTAWSDVISSGCPTTATEAGIASATDDLVSRVVAQTIVAPGVSSSEYSTISPTGTTEYLGNQITPVCMDGSPYHFFVRRGSVNKVLMYYQGGGACWEGLTCSVPTCDPNVNPDGGDNPNNVSSGFADPNNSENPFRDWNVVFVAYCSCDIHDGDAAQDYPVAGGTLHVEHRGFHNSQIAEKWAREHFLDPEDIFVTGSSAGAYGAWFNSVSLERAWPASHFDVLADAGNGVITQQFLDGPFANWNFEAHLPSDIPGVLESLNNGTGIPGYTEAVARYFPQTNWAHYATAFDGGTGGQTGFYSIMLNDNNPIAALTWWNASCAFNNVMRTQAMQTAAAVPSNYRYYIGTGSRHTMWGSDKVYTDTAGGVPTIVSWVDGMLASAPGAPDPRWTNVECNNCGVLLPGDPRPSPLAPPFEQVGDNVEIVCPQQ